MPDRQSVNLWERFPQYMQRVLPVFSVLSDCEFFEYFPPVIAGRRKELLLVELEELLLVEVATKVVIWRKT